MEQGAVIPQIDTNAGSLSNTPDPKVSALTGNTQADLANIAKEMGVTLDSRGNVATEQPKTQPAMVTPSPVPAQAASVKTDVVTEVPPKFQNTDGTVNEQKLEKSTKSIEDMLAYYKVKEKEAQQVQNRVNNPPNPQVTPAPQVMPNAPLSSLERDMATAIWQDAQALGAPVTEVQAILQARSQIRIADIRYQAELSATNDIRNELEESKRQRELEGLLGSDPDLMTPQVADRILEIRKENPAMRSYREAYIHHLGEQELAKRTGQVKTPTPTGLTARLPATPAGPVSRVQPTLPSDPNQMTNDQLEAEIRKQFPRYRGINR